MAEQRNLPGWPPKRLVKEVRSHLWRYGIRPRDGEWRSAWRWASEIAHSYYRTQWPLPNEIATQYILILLAQMHDNLAMRLPYRAGAVIPDDVRSLLVDNPIPSIEDRTPNRKHKRSTAKKS